MQYLGFTNMVYRPSSVPTEEVESPQVVDSSNYSPSSTVVMDPIEIKGEAPEVNKKFPWWVLLLAGYATYQITK